MNIPNIIKTGALLAVTAILFLFIGYKWADSKTKSTLDHQEIKYEKSTAPKVESQLESEIIIQDEYIKSSGIKVSQARVGEITNEILAPAMVSAPPGAEATVIARAAGTIKRINKRLGDAVRAGEIIATVDSLEATRMTAMRKSAISKLELAKKVFARESLLYEKGVSPRQDLEAAQSALAVAEAEAAEAQTLAQASNIASDGRSIAVISPADGKITTESTTIGAFVQPETPLFTIANEKQIQINAFITTQDLARVKVGDSATIMSRSDQEYRARVRSITPAVSGTNQTATAVLELDDKEAALVIGEGVQVRLHTSNALTNSLIVPEDAIQNIEGRDVVFVKTKTGFKPQPVVVGQRSNGYAEVISGLDPTTSIATQNVFLIKAEMIKNAPEED